MFARVMSLKEDTETATCMRTNPLILCIKIIIVVHTYKFYINILYIKEKQTNKKKNTENKQQREAKNYRRVVASMKLYSYGSRMDGLKTCK